MRVIAARHFLEAVEGYDWLTAQHTPDHCMNSYWAFVLRLDTEKVPWQDFRRKFVELGGDGIYGAWRLGYLEPMYRDMNLGGREKLIKKYGTYQYGQGLCPVAERIQPQLLQFKTNYWDERDSIRQAQILKATAEHFGK